MGDSEKLDEDPEIMAGKEVDKSVEYSEPEVEKTSVGDPDNME